MMKIKHMAASVSMAICLISLAVILTLNFRPLYYMDMKIMNLSEQTGYSESEIMENYDALIEYNSVFYRGNLEFPTLSMSEAGEIHFEEVKEIFVFFQAVLFPVTLLLSLFFVWNLRKEKPLYLKWASGLMVGIPAVLGLLIAVNWDRFFVLFHKIMFDNDYWIFDPDTDPIIDLLPDAYFMHCAIMILALVVLFSVLAFMKYKGIKIKYGVIACGVLAVISLAGCGNADGENPEEYVGKYTAMSAEVSGYQISVEEAIGKAMTLELFSDGTAEFTVGDKAEQGQWNVKNENMTVELSKGLCTGILGENTIAFDDLYSIDASILFAKEGTDAADALLYYPEEEQQVIGTWVAYSVEDLSGEAPKTTMDGVETMADAFSITFAENHKASFSYMGETVEEIDWSYTSGSCYMEGGGYDLCAASVENEELVIDIYNEDIWYTFHCVRP